MTPHRIRFFLTTFVFLLLSSAFFYSAPSSAATGWEDLEMKAVSAQGELRHLNQIQLRALTTGYYERLPTALEFSWDETEQWNRIENLRHFSLECDTFLSLGKISFPFLAPVAQNLTTPDAHLILSLKTELYSRCDIPLVYPWTFKLVLKTASGEVLGEAEFRGQPHRIRRPRRMN